MNDDLKSLELNVAKTHTCLICSKPKQRSLKNWYEKFIKIQNDDLEVVEETKYFGVQIDQHLEWKEYIKSERVSKTFIMFRNEIQA